MKRQRQYLHSCNAVLLGTMDEEAQTLAQKHGLDAHSLRLLVPLRESPDTTHRTQNADGETKPEVRFLARDFKGATAQQIAGVTETGDGRIDELGKPCVTGAQ